MKILKAMVGSDDGKIYECDVIEFEGKTWLVPHWIDAPSQGVTSPGRLILLDTIPHKRTEGWMGIVVHNPVPKALLDRETPREPISGFEVRELPDLRILISDRTSQSVAAVRKGH
jgi:hypothetical protein